MTVSYSLKVANGDSLAFFKLLLCWKGSIYKCIWLEVVLYFIMYFVISIIYRCALNQHQRDTFEAVALYCESFAAYIPITFMLGFYVSLIVGRWWEAFWKLPWPDRYISIFSAVCNGADEYSTKMRKTYLRYLICSQVLALRTISIPVKKRFPTMTHVKDAGLLTEEEMALLELKGLEQNSWAAVCFWNISLINALHDKTRGNPKKAISDVIYIKLLDEINNYKSTIGSLTCYDWISVPLQYTQVVTIAVYTFFAACLIGRQFITPAIGLPPTIDLYFPFFTFFQFCFYVGWLKVAEKLMNPFGEDDDDFETNWLIDRNLRIGSMLADDLMGEPPTLVGATFGDDVPQLPYTEGSLGVGDSPMVGSAMAVVVADDDARVIPVGGSIASARRSLASSKGSIRKKVSTFFMKHLTSRSESRKESVSPVSASQMVLEHIGEIDGKDQANHINNNYVKGAFSPTHSRHSHRSASGESSALPTVSEEDLNQNSIHADNRFFLHIPRSSAPEPQRNLLQDLSHSGNLLPVNEELASDISAVSEKPASNRFVVIRQSASSPAAIDELSAGNVSTVGRQPSGNLSAVSLQIDMKNQDHPLNTIETETSELNSQC